MRTKQRHETYGKRRGHNDLVTAFGSLCLASASIVPAALPSATHDVETVRTYRPVLDPVPGDIDNRSDDVDFTQRLVDQENACAVRVGKKDHSPKPLWVDRAIVDVHGKQKFFRTDKEKKVLQERSFEATVQREPGPTQRRRKPTSEDARKTELPLDLKTSKAEETETEVRHHEFEQDISNSKGIGGTTTVKPKSPGRRPRGRPRKAAPVLDGRSSAPSLPRSLEPLRDIIQSDTKASNFDDLYAEISNQFTLRKIDQGSFGSIYLSTLCNDEQSQTVWKVMPLRRDNDKRKLDDPRTRYRDLVAEAKLLNALSGIDGFVEMREVHLTQGLMPNGLRARDETWFEGRSIRTQDEIDQRFEQMTWSATQWWCWFEMSYAGVDLEHWLARKRQTCRGAERPCRGSFVTTSDRGPISICEAWDLFWSVSETLAYAELDMEFEHRDLHAGNICIRKSKRPLTQGPNSPCKRQSRCAEEGGVKRFSDLEATLIDYTYSRAKIPSSTTEDGEIIVTPPEGIFGQEAEAGDRQGGNQYQVYDRMLEMMEDRHSTAQSRKNGWRSYMPKTNLLWLEYLLRVLLIETGEYDPQSWRILEHDRTPDESEATETLLGIAESLNPENWRTWEFETVLHLVNSQLHRQAIDSSVM